MASPFPQRPPLAQTCGALRNRWIGASHARQTKPDCAALLNTMQVNDGVRVLPAEENTLPSASISPLHQSIPELAGT